MISSTSQRSIQANMLHRWGTGVGAFVGMAIERQGTGRVVRTVDAGMFPQRCDVLCRSVTLLARI